MEVGWKVGWTFEDQRRNPLQVHFETLFLSAEKIRKLRLSSLCSDIARGERTGARGGHDMIGHTGIPFRGRVRALFPEFLT